MLFYRPEAQPGRSIVDHIVGTFIKAPLFHPMRVVSALIQFGYEPVSATRQYSVILRRHFYYYPGIIGYSRAIAREHGWSALYRGVVPGIAEEIVSVVMSDYFRRAAVSLVNRFPLNEYPGGSDGETPDNVDNVETTRATLVRATKGFFILSISKCAVEVVTRPFHIITSRAIAQHVGQETKYSGFFSAIRQIFTDEGIRGFYTGLAPSLLYHILNSLLYEAIVVIVEESAKLVPLVMLKVGLVTIKVPMASYITRSYTYPFTLIGNLMTINNTNLKASSLNPSFSSWRDCWSYLKRSGNCYRGNVILLPRFAHTHPMNNI